MRLHHIAYVTQDILSHAESLCALLGLPEHSAPIEDPLQKVRIIMLEFQAGVSLELIEPTEPDSPVVGFLDRGGGLYHLCFEVDDLDQQLERVRQEGGVVVRRPLPAVAFDQRRVAFVMTRQRDLVEFVEAKV